MRLMVVNIKNNGLIMGVCGEKTKNNLLTAVFNDMNMITINSCGYVVNSGKMTTFNAKIKSGDTLKMVVNTIEGSIRWSCNSI